MADHEMFREPPLKQSWMLPKSVRVEGGYLVATRSDVMMHDGGYEGLLERFLALKSESDEGIADYAQEYGILGLCVHGSPAHWPHGKRGRTSGCDWSFREPLLAWRNMSTAFGALIRSAARIEAKEPTFAEDFPWISLFNGNWKYDRAEEVIERQDGRAADPEEARRLQVTMDRFPVADALNHLLKNSVTVTVSYAKETSPRPTMKFSGRSLADALAIQTAMAVCRSQSSMTCDGCGTVFVPPDSYRPREGQRRFCPDCRKAGVPQKMADKDRRDRRRSERKESEHG